MIPRRLMLRDWCECPLADQGRQMVQSELRIFRPVGVVGGGGLRILSGSYCYCGENVGWERGRCRTVDTSAWNDAPTEILAGIEVWV